MRARWRSLVGRTGWAALVTGVATLAGTGAAPRAVGAQSPTPAFFTYQAPGGSSTAGQKVVALTFDDGPGTYTPQVLSVLEQYHVPATFFEIGEHIAAYPQYTRELAAAGYPVEDHTWSHPDLSTIPVSQFPEQIDQTQEEIESLTGRIPTCVRPPYNDWDTTVLDQIAQRGLTTMSYSVDPEDWTMPGVPTIVRNVVGAAFPGAVVDLHDGGGDRSETVAALPQIITELRAEGYGFVSICGSMGGPQTSTVAAFGDAAAPGAAVTSAVPFAAATAPGTGGYWLAGQDGGVFAFDGAGYHGSLPGLRVEPTSPVVAMAATADGQGYWLTGADGGVFAFGDATYLGSMGGRPLDHPVVAMAATADGKGYWLVAADGGVFAFGDATYLGSMGGRPLDQPVVAMAATADGKGYWLVAADGGVFAFGDATYAGSMGGRALDAPVVAMAADPATGGYWLLGRDGGVFSFDAPFEGSMAGQPAGAQYFAMAATGSGRGYWLAGEHPAPG